MRNNSSTRLPATATKGSGLRNLYGDDGRIQARYNPLTGELLIIHRKGVTKHDLKHFEPSCKTAPDVLG